MRERRDKRILHSFIKRKAVSGYRFVRLIESGSGGRPHFTLCMDQDTYDVLQAMRPDNVTLIQVSALENEELLELKRTRDQSEYCWTVKPVFLEFVLDGHPELERVTYIDADLFSSLILARFLTISRIVRCFCHGAISSFPHLKNRKSTCCSVF